MVRAALATLDAAVILAQAGDRMRARQLCAAVIFEMQPLIATRKDLLRATLHAVLVAHGFKLLSRLVMAVSGRSVRVVLLAERSGEVVPPQRQEAPPVTVYTLDGGWLARLQPDDVHFQAWCDAVVSGGSGDVDAPANGSPACSLQLV